MKRIILFSLLMFFTQQINAHGKFIEMPAIFSDNMVIQQKANVNFWGKANPGEKVIVKAGFGQVAKTIVQKDSLWNVKLKTPKAGGPYEISVSVGDSIIVYKNVLVGEVWLCSGQSNMEMPLAGWPPKDTILNSAFEIKNANKLNIRFFSVARAYSDKPEFNCVGKWVEPSEEEAARFSATAFFFGKKLYEELKIPIGLINSSWGGTAVEPWTSKKYLSAIEEYKSIFTKMEIGAEEIKKENEWLKQFPIIDLSGRESKHKWENLDFKDADCPSTTFDDSKWQEMILPALFETVIRDFDGVVWFRKQIKIPSAWVGKEMVVELGPIDDMDITYINGKKIGAYEAEGFYSTDRIYEVPSGLINDSIITIAVRVVDNQGGGGLFGKKDQLKIHPKASDESISLAGTWKYLPVAKYSNDKFYVFGVKGDEFSSKPKVSYSISPYAPTTLYNGMIAPLIPYSIKGAIWYQGEANVDDPEAYKTHFPLMIKNWREDWKQGDFPFYYVQIAPYDYGESSRSERLREAQLFSLSVPNTGMAVTMDIGNPKNIHPFNKKDVGQRLAAWALVKNYNKKVFYSGPIYKSMKISKDKIILSFDFADGGLAIKEKDGENNFLIAGEDKIFKKAEVKVQGKNIIVCNPDIKNPVAVRYAWSNTNEGTLFNNKGLPASSFRTDNWEK